MSKLPTISIVIPTYNEEKYIEACLKSIFRQNYPKNLLEVFVVDNCSRDNTVKIAQKYNVKILINKIKDPEVSKMIAFKKSRGELFYYMDADLEFKNKDYLRKLVYPLLNNPLIVGSSGKVVQSVSYTSLNRFLTYDTHQRDPLLEYFSPLIYKTVVKKLGEYYLCRYTKEKIPPVGRCLYWRKKLLETRIAKAKKFMDLDNLVILVEKRFYYFAFVPQAEEYHYHVQGIKSLIGKRIRNISNVFLPQCETREYTWFNLNSKKDLIKIIAWIIYANLVIPAFVRGCIKAFRYKDFYCIWYEPFLTLVLTDITLYGFFSNPAGLKFIFNRLFR